MASAWGSWVATDDWRAGVNAWVSSQTDTTATITVQCIFDNVYVTGSNSSNGNVIRTSCNGTNKDSNISLGKNYGHYRNAVVKTDTYTVNKGSSAKNISVGAAVYVGASLYKAWSSASTTVSISAITYYTPSAATNVSAAYTSDTSQKVTWTNGATGTTTPRTANLVDREVDGGAWAQLANIGASLSNYTDATTSAGHQYRYGIRATGNGGTASRATSGYVYTSPLAPVVALAKEGKSAVTITLTPSSSYYDSFEFQVSSDNQATWADVSVTGSGLVYEDANPPAGTAYYRARAVKGDLKGAWGTSDAIQTIAPPNAPTVSSFSYCYETGSTVTVAWVPNHPDGTSQTKAQIEIDYYATGSSTATVNTYSVTTATTYSYKTVGNGSYAVRVRTYGLYDGWGEWSSYGVFNVATPPAVSITAPANGSTIAELPYTIKWTVSDDSGASSQTLAITGENFSFTKTLGGGVREFTMASDFGLDNGATYIISLSVTSGSTLVDSTMSAFSTKWTQPQPAIAEIEEHEGASVSVTLTASTVAPLAKSFTVQRRLEDGTLTTLATDVLDGESVLDYLPPLNVEYSYVITAIAESGATNSSEITNTVDSDGYEYFNFGADAGTAIGLRYNAKADESIAHSGTTFHFALGDANEPLPTFYPDGDLDVTGSHSYEIYKPDEYKKLRLVARDRNNSLCWYRSAYGRRARCLAGWTFGYDASSYNLFSVSASLTEVVWSDPQR